MARGSAKPNREIPQLLAMILGNAISRSSVPHPRLSFGRPPTRPRCKPFSEQLLASLHNTRQTHHLFAWLEPPTLIEPSLSRVAARCDPPTMPSRKRARDEMEAEEPVEEPTTLHKLRNMWQFANLMQYISMFGDAIKFDSDFDIEVCSYAPELQRPARDNLLME